MAGGTAKNGAVHACMERTLPWLVWSVAHAAPNARLWLRFCATNITMGVGAARGVPPQWKLRMDCCRFAACCLIAKLSRRAGRRSQRRMPICAATITCSTTAHHKSGSAKTCSVHAASTRRLFSALCWLHRWPTATSSMCAGARQCVGVFDCTRCGHEPPANTGSISGSAVGRVETLCAGFDCLRRCRHAAQRCLGRPLHAE